MNTRNIVLENLKKVVEANSPTPFPEVVQDDTQLEEFWLDSVAFVSLIAQVESELGFIPARLIEGAFYPETVGELVGLYTDPDEKRINKGTLGAA